MPQFQMEISLGGIILIVGQALTFIAFIWKRSGVEAEQRGKLDAVSTKLASLEAKSDGRFEQVEAEADARFAKVDMEFNAKLAALQGSVNLTRDQHHELREHLATNYMKREEIVQMERRITDNQTALRADINKLDGKIDVVQKTMLDAVASVQRTVLDAITSERRGRQ